ncbi:homeobox protein vent1B-like [Ictalurus furcatus]|uniref:homeobox protein vent1B-like n=1 Tax=Ictalurus furcatus TaxID=66913 RepID=UPI002350A64E|nr:homeobox protein vent1B-like [Ictalurus furcatus]
MVKNFSVDWLAQSYHDYKQDQEPVETSQALVKRHVPCLVQPRPPTSYDKVYIQQKLKCSRTEENTSAEEQKEKEGIVFTHSAQRNCTSPSSSENSGYSSGYESEAAASECPSTEDRSEGERDGGVQRRVRTKFTPEQIEKLEKIFSKHKYLDASERVKTAQKLNLSETQVRTWFQNRRMKLKREVQELRAEYTFPILPHVLFSAVPSLPFHFGGQRMTFPAAPHGPNPHVIPALPVHHRTIPHQQIIPQHSHHMISMRHYY